MRKTVGIDDLAVTRFVGDIFDNDVLREAMTGCDDVLLRGRHPRMADGSRAAVPHQRRGHRNVLAVATDVHREHPFRKFCLYHLLRHRRPTARAPPPESDKITDETRLPDYVRTRTIARRMVLKWVRATGNCPVVAMCVATTYGAGDWPNTARRPSPESGIRQVALCPSTRSNSKPSASIDAARAMIQPPSTAASGSAFLIRRRRSPTPTSSALPRRPPAPAPTKTLPLLALPTLAAPAPGAPLEATSARPKRPAG